MRASSSCMHARMCNARRTRGASAGAAAAAAAGAVWLGHPLQLRLGLLPLCLAILQRGPGKSSPEQEQDWWASLVAMSIPPAHSQAAEAAPAAGLPPALPASGGRPARAAGGCGLTWNDFILSGASPATACCSASDASDALSASACSAASWAARSSSASAATLAASRYASISSAVGVGGRGCAAADACGREALPPGAPPARAADPFWPAPASPGGCHLLRSSWESLRRSVSECEAHRVFTMSSRPAGGGGRAGQGRMGGQRPAGARQEKDGPARAGTHRAGG